MPLPQTHFRVMAYVLHGLAVLVTSLAIFRPDDRMLAATAMLAAAYTHRQGSGIAPFSVAEDAVGRMAAELFRRRQQLRLNTVFRPAAAASTPTASPRS